MKDTWVATDKRDKLNHLKANDKWQLLLTIIAFSIGRPYSKPGDPLKQPYYKGNLTRLLNKPPPHIKYLPLHLQILSRAGAFLKVI